MENGWLRRQRVSKGVDYKLYCHNVKCDLFAKPQVRPGYYEYDTGWGEADDDRCNACDDEMYYWEPKWHDCMRCGAAVLDDDVNATDEYCEHCASDLFEEWQTNQTEAKRALDEITRISEELGLYDSHIPEGDNE